MVSPETFLGRPHSARDTTRPAGAEDVSPWQEEMLGESARVKGLQRQRRDAISGQQRSDERAAAPISLLP